MGASQAMELTAFDFRYCSSWADPHPSPLRITLLQDESDLKQLHRTSLKRETKWVEPFLELVLGRWALTKQPTCLPGPHPWPSLQAPACAPGSLMKGALRAFPKRRASAFSNPRGLWAAGPGWRHLRPYSGLGMGFSLTLGMVETTSRSEPH